MTPCVAAVMTCLGMARPCESPWDPGFLPHCVRAAPQVWVASGQVLAKQLGTEATQENTQAESEQGGSLQLGKPHRAAEPWARGRPSSKVWAHGQELKISGMGHNPRFKVQGGDRDARIFMDGLRTLEAALHAHGRLRSHLVAL